MLQMLNSKQTVQECDATEVDSSNPVWYIKKYTPVLRPGQLNSYL